MKPKNVLRTLLALALGFAFVLVGLGSVNGVIAGGDEVDICHKGSDKSVPVSAVAGHVGHGDKEGRCNTVPPTVAPTQPPVTMVPTNAPTDVPATIPVTIPVTVEVTAPPTIPVTIPATIPATIPVTVPA